MANPKRPKDPVSRAVMVGRILLGEIKDDTTEPKPASGKAKAGAKGGATRARSLSAAKRSEIAKKAAAKRWGKRD